MQPHPHPPTRDRLQANARDVQEAQGKITDSLMQRLVLKPAKIAQLAEGIRAIAAQEEPLGRLLRKVEVAEGECRRRRGVTGRLEGCAGGL